MPAKTSQAGDGRREAASRARLARAKARKSRGEPADRRRQIAQAAARLFAEYGYEATSIRDIADVVSVLPGSLYHHFPTKEDILHDILRPAIQAATIEGDRVHSLPIDPEHMLVTSVLTRYYQHINDWEFRQILDVDSKMLRTSEEFKYVLHYKERMFAFQEDVIRRGIDHGLFDPDIDPYLMIINISRIISSSAIWFCSGVRHSADRSQAYTLDHIIDFNLNCILRMVRQPSRIAQPVPRAACELLISHNLARPSLAAPMACKR